jgi:hypothetical protein
MTESTQSLQNLLGMLGHSAAGDQSAVLQKLESIQQQTLAAFASLDFLHEKVDALCASMQQTHAQQATDAPAEVLLSTALPQSEPSVTYLPRTCESTDDQDFSAVRGLLSVCMRVEDAPDEMLGSSADKADASAAQASAVHMHEVLAQILEPASDDY